MEKILDVADKYSAYFEEWGADIAISRNGPNFFYVLDDGVFDVFSPFTTADELEELILGDIASKMSMCISMGDKKFTLDALNEVYDNYYPEASLLCLLRDLKVLAEENARWCDFMGKTYRALAGIVEK